MYALLVRGLENKDTLFKEQSQCKTDCRCPQPGSGPESDVLLKHTTSVHIEIQTRRRHQAVAHVTYRCKALILINQAYEISL